MFMNLHDTPAGTSYYTAYITDSACSVGLLDGTVHPNDAYCEEIDIIAPSSARTEELLRLAQAEMKKGYDPDMQVIGIADQSSGYFPYLSDAGRILV